MSQIPFNEIRSWMFEEALPFWGDRGLDREQGGFREELSLEGQPTNVDFRRVRVICRQIYVFSHAALLGWKPGLALSEMGFRYLIEHAWMGAGKGGWAKLLNRDGSVRDRTPDLYDIAFVLFALAWRYRASGDGEAHKYAHETLDFVDRHMRAETGFWHQLPPEGPRLQNPHMHLLEASIASFEAFKEQRFLNQATEIVGLFRKYFFDGTTLGEYFTNDLQRVAGDEGKRAEPGHHFEWAWILSNYQHLTGTDLTREAKALDDFGERCGVDPKSHATYDEVRDDCMPLRKTSRTWPNTERIKGHLALFELTGADPREAVTQSVRLLLDRYLNVTPRGSWIDEFDADGKPLAKTAPTSTLYHVFLAFSEVLRLEPKLKAL